MVKKNARYAKGTVLRLRVIRLPVYASPQPSAEHESDKTVEVIQYLSDGRIMLRMRGAQPGRSHFTGSLSSTITNMAARPVKYEVLGVHVVSEPRSTPNRRKRTMRKNTAIQMHATPYDVSASGFYFRDPDDFAVKYEKHLPVEEYEIQWIGGPEEDRELFEALDVNQGTLDKFFDLIGELNEHDKAALYYLLRHRGMGPKEDLDDLLKLVEDEVRVMEGDSKDYVYELIDDIGMDGIGPNNMQQYFDFERFGRDIAMDMDADDENDAFYLDMSDEERGQEYVDSMGGVGELGKTAQDYFDVEAFARDMELNGELHEFDYAGKTYTTTFMG